MRIDLQAVAVLGAALAASFATAAAIRHVAGAETEHAEAAVLTLAPTDASPASGRDAQVVRAADGHYWAEARIEGRAVRVLVDTGASVVALTRADAVRLGVDPAPEAFTGQVQTASGVARAAPVELRTVSVSGARVDAVQALVVEEGLAYSLLGMSYLGRLSGFEATPSGLTLRP